MKYIEESNNKIKTNKNTLADGEYSSNLANFKKGKDRHENLAYQLRVQSTLI